MCWARENGGRCSGGWERRAGARLEKASGPWCRDEWIFLRVRGGASVVYGRRIMRTDGSSSIASRSIVHHLHGRVRNSSPSLCNAVLSALSLSSRSDSPPRHSCSRPVQLHSLIAFSCPPTHPSTQPSQASTPSHSLLPRVASPFGSPPSGLSRQKRKSSDEVRLQGGGRTLTSAHHSFFSVASLQPSTNQSGGQVRRRRDRTVLTWA
jgi:hypothetical protein